MSTRAELGHWEADTMLGASQAGPCVLSMVERQSGYVLLGQLAQRTSAFVNARARQMIRAQRQPVQTITVDNGTEFHEYVAARGCDRHPLLLRDTASRLGTWHQRKHQRPDPVYLPKRQRMAHLTQHDCNRIAAKLNRRPRKRLGFRTPEECYAR